MQLYHSSQISYNGSKMMITDPRLLYQVKRVMRSRTGDRICVQYDDGGCVVRCECILSLVSDKIVEAEIVGQERLTPPTQVRHLIIAMSNKRDKMELIIQKVTECGITHITVVPMHRSVIRYRNDHKWSRLETIMIEAVEQSWSGHMPVLQWCDRLDHLTLSGQCLLANMGGQSLSDIQVADDCCLIVGPEGGFDPKDLVYLEEKELDITTISLGSSVLRMETAAIVGSRYLCAQ